MLKSLSQRLRQDFRPALYLLHTTVSPGSLATIASRHETYPLVPSPDQLLLAHRSSRFPPEASFPLLLAEVLPKTIERVLFLDADTLVLDDLALLWETPLEGRILAACQDAAIPLCSSPRGVKGWMSLGLPADTPYFNAGALLIDLERWRHGNATERIHRYFATTPGPVDFLHQEAMNAALWNDWKSLDPRWNLLASQAGRAGDRSSGESWRRPGIVHFSGRAKPWRCPVGGPFNEPYRKVLEEVLTCIPAERPGMSDRLMSIYDRRLRPFLYPIERAMWRKRLI